MGSGFALIVASIIQIIYLSVFAYGQSSVSNLVAELREAPTEVDRLTILKDEDFLFDFLHATTGVTTGAAGHTVAASSENFPAVVNNGVSMTVGFLGPCGMNTPHTHPRATEINFSLNTTLRAGFLVENGARFVDVEIAPGSAAVFPQGAIHFEMNPSCETAMFVAAFNNEDPGVSQVAERYFGLPSDIVGATLDGLGVVEVLGLESKIPDNVAFGVDSCLQRCNITRGEQPTSQLQPPASSQVLSSSSIRPASSSTAAAASFTSGGLSSSIIVNGPAPTSVPTTSSDVSYPTSIYSASSIYFSPSISASAQPTGVPVPSSVIGSVHAAPSSSSESSIYSPIYSYSYSTSYYTAPRASQSSPASSSMKKSTMTALTSSFWTFSQSSAASTPTIASSAVSVVVTPSPSATLSASGAPSSATSSLPIISSSSTILPSSSFIPSSLPSSSSSSIPSSSVIASSDTILPRSSLSVSPSPSLSSSFSTFTPASSSSINFSSSPTSSPSLSSVLSSSVSLQGSRSSSSSSSSAPSASASSIVGPLSSSSIRPISSAPVSSSTSASTSSTLSFTSSSQRPSSSSSVSQSTTTVIVSSSSASPTAAATQVTSSSVAPVPSIFITHTISWETTVIPSASSGVQPAPRLIRRSNTESGSELNLARQFKLSSYITPRSATAPRVLSPAIIALICVNVVLFIVLVLALYFWIRRRNRRAEHREHMYILRSRARCTPPKDFRYGYDTDEMTAHEVYSSVYPSTVRYSPRSF